jgi:hypothetical protein
MVLWMMILTLRYVDDSDDDWCDNDKGDGDNESENEPKLQHKRDHDNNIQHVPHGFIPNGNLHTKLAFSGANGSKVDTEN